jgi:hypothetical protein
LSIFWTTFPTTLEASSTVFDENKRLKKSLKVEIKSVNERCSALSPSFLSESDE